MECPLIGPRYLESSLGSGAGVHRAKDQRVRYLMAKRRAMNSGATLSARALYTVPEAMEMLNLSRRVIYEQIRSGRLLTVTQGRRRLVPASSMTAYVDLLVTEALARTNARTPSR
jgi:excisionase family DNA binding protein